MRAIGCGRREGRTFVAHRVPLVAVGLEAYDRGMLDWAQLPPEYLRRSAAPAGARPNRVAGRRLR
jgi:hypothetical protein